MTAVARHMISSVISVMLAFTPTLLEARQQASPGPLVSVGTARARPGETAYGEIVAPGAGASGPIPVAVIQGVKPGPVVAMMAGGHGTEYATVVALSQLISR